MAYVISKIKNTIAITTALAAIKSEDLNSSYISCALEANGKDLPVLDDILDLYN